MRARPFERVRLSASRVVEDGRERLPVAAPTAEVVVAGRRVERHALQYPPIGPEEAAVELEDGAVRIGEVADVNQEVGTAGANAPRERGRRGAQVTRVADDGEANPAARRGWRAEMERPRPGTGRREPAAIARRRGEAG